MQEDRNWPANAPSGIFKSDFNIWSQYFELTELLKVSESCAFYETKPDILDWLTIEKSHIQILDEAVVIEEEFRKNLCSTTSSNSLGMIVPNQVYPIHGMSMCKSVTAELFIPQTKEAYYQMVKRTDPKVLEKCPYVILPFTQQGIGNWIDQDGKSFPTELKWLASEPNGGILQKCTITSPMIYEYEAADVACESFSLACPICKWKQTPVFLLKGLCANFDIEYRYVLEIGDTFNEMLIFKGFNGLFILFDKDINRWIVSRTTNTKDAKSMIAMQVDKQNSPIGLRDWKMMDDDCQGVMPLKVSSVCIFRSIQKCYKCFN